MGQGIDQDGLYSVEVATSFCISALPVAIVFSACPVYWIPKNRCLTSQGAEAWPPPDQEPNLKRVQAK